MDIYDAAERYIKEKTSVIILAGKDYGSGSSRDWAAKGPFLQVEVIPFQISASYIDFQKGKVTTNSDAQFSHSMSLH